MATQMRLKVYLEGKHMTARTFRKKKNNNKVESFSALFFVYTNVDNRERARASY